MTQLFGVRDATRLDLVANLGVDALEIARSASQVHVGAFACVHAARDAAQMLTQRLERLRWELAGVLFGELEHEQVGADDAELVTEHGHYRADG